MSCYCTNRVNFEPTSPGYDSTFNDFNSAQGYLCSSYRALPTSLPTLSYCLSLSLCLSVHYLCSFNGERGVFINGKSVSQETNLRIIDGTASGPARRITIGEIPNLVSTIFAVPTPQEFSAQFLPLPFLISFICDGQRGAKKPYQQRKRFFVFCLLSFLFLFFMLM